MASSAPSFRRLVRFVPRSDPSKVLIGQPQDDNLDVGVALRKGQDVPVNVFSGSSVLSPGQETGKSAIIDRVLSPLSVSEVGTIRCIGLNVSDATPTAGMNRTSVFRDWTPESPQFFSHPALFLGAPRLM
ncbi:hypothetical protein ABEF92_007030 [Exophiala dermatitidis]|uniref:Uncharacterized protein n=1 Tax=Exophiala dermatitidis (strain ATCC 34100 / CBS 525.76 / NIH/UT8656) TaxID=858893 RepID=H6C6L9_EXODN|nr:uncharacterized protein HMPREF1120_07356 [Exophiala dermatitidis NIH/UT8656]EHY59365.1 hypothetical protein HMPREF1120_07356 [Exophiala dermatitidis NIH/UT8656]KAJ4522861.1 hypothetical protein HRR75_001255 [Exophiala dermatitidis]KAJ4559829.1 hypothetical protein HRR78_000349 [Exophiala dermatitidis]